MVKFFRELVFPYRLGRLSYFVRFWLMIALEYYVLLGFHNPSLGGIVILALLAYMLTFCLMPRARDCGLPIWVTFLIFAPVICLFPMIVLWFKRSRLTLVMDPEADALPENQQGNSVMP